MGKRARRERIYRLLRAEGISKKKARRAAKRLDRDASAKTARSKLAALGARAKAVRVHRPNLHRQAAD
jgi:hypothetical protein